MAGLQDFSKKYGRVDIHKVAPQDLVIIEGWNARSKNEPEVAAHIRRIADTIKATGITYIPPLTVYMMDGKPVVSDGYCRTNAALLAIEEGAEVPFLYVRPEERHANDADRKLSILNRNEPGLALTPLQQAKVIRELLDMGLEDKEIAQRTAKSITHIQNMVALLAVPEEVKKMVANGDVSARAATATLKQEGEAKGTEIIREAVAAAKQDGKKKATPKEIGKVKAKMDPPAADPVQAAVASLFPAPVDWRIWEPRVLRLLEAIRDAEGTNRLLAIQGQVGPLLDEMRSKK
jgi:hypothetical protein